MDHTLPANPLWWTEESLEELTDQEIREAIASIESIYDGYSPQNDFYREQLTRRELKNIFFLVQRLAELKTASGNSVAHPVS